jgi:hypothetical protein
VAHEKYLAGSILALSEGECPMNYTIRLLLEPPATATLTSHALPVQRRGDYDCQPVGVITHDETVWLSHQLLPLLESPPEWSVVARI